MLNLYNWITGTTSSNVPPVPQMITIPSFTFLKDDVKPGPGRNIPPLLNQIKDSKLNLKSPSVIKILKSLNQIDDLMFIKVRKNLKSVKTRPIQTNWPCTNPLFIELRNTHKKFNRKCISI
jgi:hypothetical protein